MDKLKWTVSVEPKNKYEKAKQDLFQAWKSIRELSPEEQRVLAEEFFGAARVAVAVEMFGKRLGEEDKKYEHNFFDWQWL